MYFVAAIVVRSPVGFVKWRLINDFDDEDDDDDDENATLADMETVVTEIDWW